MNHRERHPDTAHLAKSQGYTPDIEKPPLGALIIELICWFVVIDAGIGITIPLINYYIH